MIKSKNGIVTVNAKSKEELMADLVIIVNSLKEKYGEKDVREAVEFGFKNEEEIILLFFRSILEAASKGI